MPNEMLQPNGSLAPERMAMAAPRRAVALDALRGASILLMVLTANVPWNLPLGVERWLVHAQTPPPSHVFNPALPGINGIDLVFPFFVFCLGAATPLALTRRLEAGAPVWRIVADTLWRGLLLALFAFYIPHVRPWELSGDPTRLAWVRAMVAYAALFPVFLRLPRKWPALMRFGVRTGGWIACIGFVVTARFEDGSGPLPAGAAVLPRVDSVIWTLSNVAVATALVWLVTRRRRGVRLALIAALAAIHLCGGVGWVHAAWSWTPGAPAAFWSHATRLPWLWRNEYLEMLMIALPGSLAGERLLIRMRNDGAGAASAWSRSRRMALAAIALLLTGVCIWGLFTRHVATAALGSALLGLAGWRLSIGAATGAEALLAWLFRSGLAWLAVGLALEPLEGGIKKEPATLSFYLVTAGLAALCLMALTVASQTAALRRPLAWLGGAGQNPMMAYLGFSNVVQPALILAGVTAFVNMRAPSPWAQLAYAVAGAALMAALVAGCSRRGIIWRA
jgi:predicted acyltransferase